MEISFKPVELSDIDALLIFIQEYYDYDRHPFEATRTRTALENLIRHPDWGRVWFISHERYLMTRWLLEDQP